MLRRPDTGRDARRPTLGAPTSVGGPGPLWYPETIDETIRVAAHPTLGYVATDESDRLSVLTDRVTGETYEQAFGAAQVEWIESDATHGKPAMRFAGAQYLSTQDGVLAGLLDEAAPYTAFTVCHRANTAALHTLFSVAPTATAPHAIGERWNNGALYKPLRADDTGATSIVSSVVADPGDPGWMVSVFTGSARWVSWNGADIIGTYAAPVANTKAPTCDRFHIGSLFYNGSHIQLFDGDISLILIFAGVLSESKIGDVEAWLATEFPGLTP